MAIRLPIKCGKSRAAAGGQSFGGSDTDSDTQSTKSTGSAHRVAARTFKKSFKGKAVAIVKPFSSVSGEKRSPGGGPVKEQKSGGSSKSDLLNLLYDFKSDEESSASVERQRESSAGSQLLSGSDSGVTGTVTTAAKSPNCDESDTDTVVKLVTPPPPAGGVSASALVRAEISSAATAAKQIRGGSNNSTGGAKPSVVARRLKFGGAPPELKAVRVRVEKLQQASAPPLYAAAAPAANQPNPTSVSGKYSARKPEDGGGGEETIKKEPAAEACSVIGSQSASSAEIKSEPVVDSVGSSASDCSTEEKKVGEVKVEVEPTAAIPPDIKPGKGFFI